MPTSEPIFSLLEAAAKAVGLVVAIGGGGALIAKKAWRYAIHPAYLKVKGVINGFGMIAVLKVRIDQQERDLSERLDRQDYMLRSIRAELKPNGGSSLRDVVDRLSVEAAASRGLLRTLYNASAMASFHCDPVGEYTFANEVYLRLVGRNIHDVLGSNWLNCVEPSEREMVRQSWEDSIYNRRIFEMRFYIAQPRGVKVPVLCRAEPFLDDKHRVVMWLGSLYRVDIGPPIPSSSPSASD